VADTVYPFWADLGDPNLEAQVARAFQHNPSLLAMAAKLTQARAVARKSGATDLPTLDASVGASLGLRDGPVGGPSTTRSLTLGLSASYELDLWGRLEAEQAADRLEAEASREDLRTALITLAAETATAWFGLVEQLGQRTLLAGQLATNTHVLAIIEARFRSGQISVIDVLQQRQLVEALAGERLQVETSLELQTNVLALLTGTLPEVPSPPEDLTLPGSVPSLPPLPLGTYLETILARPDLRAALHRVEAGDARLSAALADRYPRLSLVAKAETTTEALADLFDNWLANLLANLTAPLLDGNRRTAEVELRRARLDELAATYRHTYLRALREVADALVRERQQVLYVQSLERQLTLSEQATTQTFSSYSKGALDFTRYLMTLLEDQRLRRTLLRARREALDYRLALHRVLAGPLPPSVSNDPAPTPPESGGTE